VQPNSKLEMEAIAEKEALLLEKKQLLMVQFYFPPLQI